MEKKTLIFWCQLCTFVASAHTVSVYGVNPTNQYRDPISPFFIDLLLFTFQIVRSGFDIALVVYGHKVSILVSCGCTEQWATLSAILSKQPCTEGLLAPSCF